MKMFKTSMRGFKKSDVNNYIIELNKDFSDIKANYELEISELKLKLKNAEDKIDSLTELEERLNESVKENLSLKEDVANYKDRLDELSEAYDTVCEENKEKSDNIEALFTEKSNLLKNIEEKEAAIENLNAAIKDKSDIIDSKTEKISKLENEISEERSLSLGKDNKLVEASKQITEVKASVAENEEKIKNLILHNSEMENLLKQATAKLSAYESERATEAEKEIVSKKARKADAALMNATSSVTANVTDAVVESAESCLKEFQQFADKVQFTSKNAISELAEEYTLLASRAAYYCEILDSTAKKTLSEFRGKANAICNSLRKDN